MDNFSCFFEKILIKKIQYGDFDSCINFYENNYKIDLTGKSIFLISCSYSKRGDYLTAIKISRKGYRKFKQPEFLREIGKNYIKFNNYKKAARYLKLYLLKMPDSIMGKYYLGISYKYCNDLENALYCFTSFLREKDDYFVWFYVEEILYELKKYKESITAGNEAIKYNDKFSPAFIYIAKSYYELKDYQNSLKYFQSYEDRITSEKENCDLETMFYCSKILLLLDKDIQAREYIFKILEKNPDNIETLEMLFYSYVKFNDYKNCIEIGEKILRKANKLKIVAHLVIIYFMLNEFEKSEEKIKILFKYGFESASAFKILVESFIKLEKFDKAYFYIEKLLPLEKTEDNNYLYALILFKLKKYNEAKDIYYDLVKNNKLDLKLRFEYSQILYFLNEKKEAFNNLKFILDKNINNEEILFLFTQICFEYSDFISALEYIKKFILINTKNDRVWFLYGICFEYKKDIMRAIKCVNKAIKLNQKDNYKKKRLELIQKIYRNI